MFAAKDMARRRAARASKIFVPAPKASPANTSGSPGFSLGMGLGLGAAKPGKRSSMFGFFRLPGSEDGESVKGAAGKRDSNVREARGGLKSCSRTPGRPRSMATATATAHKAAHHRARTDSDTPTHLTTPTLAQAPAQTGTSPRPHVRRSRPSNGSRRPSGPSRRRLRIRRGKPVRARVNRGDTPRPARTRPWAP